ncbi:magnesium transporter [Rosistilla oblonga]|uniref:Magnesium transporter MgtE n=1 Tax=Rosistilla oblonga TaxID=2527990 RepID=A0A518ITE1_9BACT|nr:magnesium transporter [Rosistilla oblonga]QDV56340.1 Magnesium transporter MgtE [Rosistilla oblonga]
MVNTLFLPELREMLAESNDSDLAEFCTALHPVRTAEFMEGLTANEAWQVLQHADVALRAEIFSYLDEERQLEILEQEDPQRLADLVAEMPSDDRVDLIHELEDERANEILPLLPEAERRDIMRLKSHAEETAGALMTTDFVRLSASLTVREALDDLSRQAADHETIYYLYVVDEDHQLRGVVSGRQLIAAMGKPNTTMGELMDTDIVTVQIDEDQESVAEKVERYNLLAIPVVDEGRVLMGIITHDDVIDVLRDELTEDVQRIAAVAPLDEGYLRENILTLTWKRGIWLTVLFFAAMLTMLLLRHYDVELEKFIWLAWFIPLVISSGGNTGSQSATLVITALTSGDVKVGDWRTVARREVMMGVLLGGSLGTIGYIFALFVAPSAYAAITIPITVLLVISSGAIAGGLLPLLFKRLELDPALMSNPFVAGIVDILGIMIYINVARIVLSGVAE